MGERSVRRVGAVLLTACAAIALVPTAAQAQPSVAVRYDIPAQDLGNALTQLARQSNREIYFPSDLTRGIRARRLRGRMTLEQALGRLLDGTGLRHRISAGGAITIERVSAASPDPEGAHPPGEARAGGAAADEAGADVEGVPEILVTGERPSLNADIRRSEDGIQPYVVVTRQEIERSGARNVEELLRRSFAQESSSSSAAQQPDTSGVAPFINFRGLNPRETLILVDGRRVASGVRFGDFSQPDIQGIPLGSIERIEVLPATASAIYGGGATGAVVNIVLRRDYNGVDVALRQGITSRGDGYTNRIDATAGINFNAGRTNLLVALSRNDEAGIQLGDRDVLQRYRDRVARNNPATFLNPFLLAVGTTSNIASQTGAPLTLKPAFGGGSIGSNVTSVPLGYGGPASDNGAGLIANAGRLNLEVADTGQVGGGTDPLRPETQILSANITLRHQFSSAFQMFVEAFYSENSSEWLNSVVSSPFFLSAADAGNPFNEDIAVSSPAYGADTEWNAKFREGRLVVGAIFNLPHAWRGAADYTYGFSRRDISWASSGQFSPQAAADVASGALNVFRDFTADGRVFAPYVLENYDDRNEASAHLFALRLAGPLPLSLFGNRPILSLVGEHRRENVEASSILELQYPERSQVTSSAFAELTVPIVTERDAMPGIRKLELQLAARADWYELNSTTNAFSPPPIVRTERRFSEVSPTMGLLYQPLPDIAFRASYARGFLPPTLDNVSPAQPIPFNGAFYGLTDPARGGEPIGVYDIIVGGNPAINPERSRTITAGVILTPRFANGLRLRVDWVRIRKRDGIEAAFNVYSQETLLDFIEFAPDRIIRNTDPSTFGSFGIGPVIAIDQTVGNVTGAEFENLDLNLDYTFQLPIGQFTLSANATRVLAQKFQFTPASPINDLAGLSVARFRGIGSLGWSRGPWYAAWTVRHIGPYRLDALYEPDQGGFRIRSQTYHDFYLRYRFAEESRSLFRGLSIEAGVTNLFDSTPPFDATRGGAGGYSTLGDATGANFYLTVRKQF